ncbi:thermonuclease family protein [Candidatus Terasakiella magnetica]|nr:thermonuclease family protein [Candidatus Terasakiella magnetica]
MSFPVFAGIPAKVLYVIDGDTFKAKLDLGAGKAMVTSVRVAHIDTPETKWGFECLAEKRAGLQASSYARFLLREGSQVQLSHFKKDKYEGRVVAQVTLGDGRDYGAVMLSQKLAVPYEGGRKQKIWCGAK